MPSGTRKGSPWSDQENDLIVADYFAMLENDILQLPYGKAAHRRALMPQLNKRSEGSIEFKHQNISAVLMGLGLEWIEGYKPAFNFQESLIQAIERYLEEHSDWRATKFLGKKLDERLGAVSVSGEDVKVPILTDPIEIHTPPTQSNQPPPREWKKAFKFAVGANVAGRDERNAALGRAGEKLVLAHERLVLKQAGRTDLAKEVRWVSELDGDGYGYDIASFTPEGQPRLLEVKTTRGGWEYTPFFISRNELAVSQEQRSDWRLFRLWNFSREPKAFELVPPLENHVSLMATSYQASFPYAGGS